MDDYQELIERLRSFHAKTTNDAANAVESLLAKNEWLKSESDEWEANSNQWEQEYYKKDAELAKYRDALESHGPEGRNYTNLQVVEMRQKFIERINEHKAELAKYRDAPVVAHATTNEEGDLSMLFFDKQEARQYSGDDEPIKLIVKPGEEK